MKWVPQIRLRTILLVFVCAAVGFSIGTAPVWNEDVQIGRWLLALNWHYAFLAAASVAVVVGLLQEVKWLRSWQTPELLEGDAARFARQFAVIWRLAIATLLIVCLVAAVLLARGLIELPESESYLSFDVFPYAIWIVSLLVVLSAIYSKWLVSGARAPSVLHVVIVTFVAMVLGVIILPESALISFLVHLATAGIEFAQPPIYRRPGEFPDHSAEGFRTFWIATCAAIAITMTSPVLVFLAACERYHRVLRAICMLFLLFLVSESAVYCYWYYACEFYRVSPYLAANAVGSGVIEWLAGIALAILVTTAAAHRLSTVEGAREFVSPIQSEHQAYLPFHQTMGCLLLIAFAWAIYLLEYVAVSTYGSLLDAEVLLWMFRDPCTLLILGACALSLQLCWLQWRKPGHACWTITPIDSRHFVRNWLAVALVACVGIPTLSAFVFSFWLGPWYLYGQ